MNIHEHQAKELLRRHGVPLLEGGAAYSADEAVGVAGGLGGEVWVVKAQIHAGGRGKAGGVKVVRSLEEVRAAADELLGKVLVTPQTGAEGKEVRRLYVEAGAVIAREFYVSLLVDRQSGQVAFVASAEGGVEIEKVARETPEKILTLPIDPLLGVRGYHGERLAKFLGLQENKREVLGLMRDVYAAFWAYDFSLLEINPLAQLADGKLVCLDAKAAFEDNALYRQKEAATMLDPTEEDPAEARGREHGLSYIRLDGNIGCMVNGAGLAMATMDAVLMEGGSPANFLDVGGGATAEKVAEAFGILLEDENVRGVLVNIFGGIMQCDVIAEGVVTAAKQLGVKVPLVVRLAGSRVEEGREILAHSGLAMETAEGLAEAAKQVVALVGKTG